MYDKQESGDFNECLTLVILISGVFLSLGRVDEAVTGHLLGLWQIHDL